MLSFQAMVKTAATSSWTALRNRGFRLIWLASVISGACASAHGTAATWAVNELSHSTLLLSMMSTFSSLPFFLFTLPAGALADIVDRAKLVRITHVLVSSLSRRPRDSRLVASPQWPPHTALCISNRSRFCLQRAGIFLSADRHCIRRRTSFGISIEWTAA